MDEVENYELESSNMFMFFSNFFSAFVIYKFSCFFFFVIYLFVSYYLYTICFYPLLELAPKPIVGKDSILD